MCNRIKLVNNSDIKTLCNTAKAVISSGVPHIITKQAQYIAFLRRPPRFDKASCSFI